MNPTQQGIQDRKSVRVFLDQPVTPAMKEQLLEAAFQAPTAGCQQLYTILDITDPERKARLADLCDHQPFIATAPVVLIFLADCARWPQVYQEAGCEPRPAGAGDLFLAVADACIAAQNVVVAAQSLGLGSCYIVPALPLRTWWWPPKAWDWAAATSATFWKTASRCVRSLLCPLRWFRRPCW